MTLERNTDAEQVAEIRHALTLQPNLRLYHYELGNAAHKAWLKTVGMENVEAAELWSRLAADLAGQIIQMGKEVTPC